MTILNGQLHGNEPDAMDSAAFQRIFVTALLLTRSAKAECSVLEGLTAASQGDESGGALLHATLRAAIAAPVGVALHRPETQDLSTSSLPVELRRVLLLSESLRQCFVLRLLVGLSVIECSRLLSLNACQIEQNTAAAALALSGIQELEAGSDATTISVVCC